VKCRAAGMPAARARPAARSEQPMLRAKRRMGQSRGTQHRWALYGAFTDGCPRFAAMPDLRAAAAAEPPLLHDAALIRLHGAALISLIDAAATLEFTTSSSTSSHRFFAVASQRHARRACALCAQSGRCAQV